MPVARTYEKFPIVGNPFKENGKMYVNIQTNKGEKKVRWYTEAERARMDKTAGVTTTKDIMDFDGRYAFGFGDEGYITIYKGDEEEIDAWAQNHHECVRRNMTFGYYTPSRLVIHDLPASITPVKLKWECVMDNGNKMKSHEEVQRYVNNLLNEGQIGVNSTFQGTVDTWIERDLIITANKKTATMFGDKAIHTMMDAAGNIYKWETSSKNFPVGSSKHLKMKVKKHVTVMGIPITEVYYCKEI